MIVGSETRFSAARGIGDLAEGPAVIATVAFSARYDLDRETGTISRLSHPLHGTSIAHQILIFPGVQGGVAGAWAFLAMAATGVGPAGLVFADSNPVVVQGAVAAGIPILDGIDRDVFSKVRNGDFVTLDPRSRILILKRTRSPTEAGGAIQP